MPPFRWTCEGLAKLPLCRFEVIPLVGKTRHPIVGHPLIVRLPLSRLEGELEVREFSLHLGAGQRLAQVAGCQVQLALVKADIAELGQGELCAGEGFRAFIDGQPLPQLPERLREKIFPWPVINFWSVTTSL